MQIAQRLFQGMDIGGGDLEGLISYHRTDSTTLSDKALREAGAGGARDVRRRLLQRAAPVPDQGAQRAGSARSDSPDRLPPHAAVARARARERRAAHLRADLEARDRVADGRRAHAAHDASRSPATATDGEPAMFTASGKAIEFAGYLRAYVEGSDDPAAELDEQETLLPKLAVGDQVHAPDKLDAELIVAGARRQGPRDHAAGALHRSVAGQAARRGRHRPAVDLRADRRDHSAPRLRVAPGQGAGAELHRVCRHAAAARSLRRLRRHRLHRRDGRDPRQDLQRREGLARLHPRVLSRRRQAPRPRAPRRGQGPGDRLPGDRCSATIPRAGLPVRVRIGRYGPFLQLGDTSDDGPRASLPEDLAPADLTLEKAIALLKAKARGAASRSASIPTTGQHVYVMHGRFGAYVQLGETPTTRTRREAAPRVARPRLHRRHHHARRRAASCCRCRASSAPADDGEAIVANVGRFGPYVKHGSEFRSLEADRRRLHDHARAREGAAGAAEEVDAPRSAPAPKELRALGKHPDSGDAGARSSTAATART